MVIANATSRLIKVQLAIVFAVLRIKPKFVHTLKKRFIMLACISALALTFREQSANRKSLATVNFCL